MMKQQQKNKAKKLDEVAALLSKTAGGPMRKAGCGMVHFHHDKLAVIGGYGYPTGPPQPGSTFINVGTDGRGATNEIHVFDLSQGSHKIHL